MAKHSDIPATCSPISYRSLVSIVMHVHLPSGGVLGDIGALGQGDVRGSEADGVLNPILYEPEGRQTPRDRHKQRVYLCQITAHSVVRI